MTLNPVIEENKFNKKRGWRVSLMILASLAFFISISLFSNAVVFSFIVFGLMYDYFVLLGGNLHWLNRILDDREFNGTGIYRRMLAADAKMIILAMSSGLWIVFLNESQSNIAHQLMASIDVVHLSSLTPDISMIIKSFAHNHISAFDYITNFESITSFRESIPRFLFIFFIKIFMLGQLTHSIHHILLNEKFTGMKFSGYAPTTAIFKKVIEWARRRDDGKAF